MRSGRERIVDVHASPFRGGDRSGLVLVLHDISELRRLERIRRDFVANVSHELKTPLTSIKGFIETLLAGALHDEHNNERFLRRIDWNVDRLTHLVADLLSLARIESGATIQRVPVDWRRILTDVLRRHEEAIRSKGLELQVAGTTEAVLVAGDPEAMTQVLENLVDNAVKYTTNNGRIRVQLFTREGIASLIVEDTGIGIPSAELDRVFERFYRVDKARSREVGGTGLGLSIVKHLVMAMGGTVRVASDVGRGSRFTVDLPAA
jgi:two-component system phosphate regulon sensor histidine kinase PhoR